MPLTASLKSSNNLVGLLLDRAGADEKQFSAGINLFKEVSDIMESADSALLATEKNVSLSSHGKEEQKNSILVDHYHKLWDNFEARSKVISEQIAKERARLKLPEYDESKDNFDRLTPLRNQLAAMNSASLEVLYLDASLTPEDDPGKLAFFAAVERAQFPNEPLITPEIQSRGRQLRESYYFADKLRNIAISEIYLYAMNLYMNNSLQALQSQGMTGNVNAPIRSDDIANQLESLQHFREGVAISASKGDRWAKAIQERLMTDKASVG